MVVGTRDTRRSRHTARTGVAVALFVLAAALVLLPAPGRWVAAATPGGDGTGPVVVELFTSQGCASCPPADALLGELAERPEVIALGLHVDYWDYIGWADPYGAPAHTARQRSYAERLPSRWMYTPQAVVDGRTEVVGSNGAALRALIENALAKPNAVQPRFEPGQPTDVVIPAGEAPAPATVWIAYFDRRHVDQVPRGENAGKTLRSYNVVRRLERLGTWDGTERRFTLDADAARSRGRTGCAVIVQAGGTGPILGAARMDLPPES